MYCFYGKCNTLPCALANSRRLLLTLRVWLRLLQGALVKGAARAAAVLLGARSGGAVLARVIAQRFCGGPRPLDLPAAQLAAAFAALGGSEQRPLRAETLCAAAAQLGAQLRVQQARLVMDAMAPGAAGGPDAAAFAAWWAEQCKAVLVQEISCEAALMACVHATQRAAAAGSAEPSVVVLCVGATSCRPCIKFAATYEGLARRFPTARFLRVNADAGPGALALAQALQVDATPQFLFYAAGVETARVEGANAFRVEAALAATLAASQSCRNGDEGDEQQQKAQEGGVAERGRVGLAPAAGQALAAAAAEQERTVTR